MDRLLEQVAAAAGHHDVLEALLVADGAQHAPHRVVGDGAIIGRYFHRVGLALQRQRADLAQRVVQRFEVAERLADVVAISRQSVSTLCTPRFTESAAGRHQAHAARHQPVEGARAGVDDQALLLLDRSSLPSGRRIARPARPAAAPRPAPS